MSSLPSTGLSLPVLAALFDTFPLGVVVLDRHGNVVVYNQREAELARRSREDVLGRSFFEVVAPCMNVRELAGAFQAGIDGEVLDRRIEFSFPFPFLERPRDVLVHLRSMRVDDEPYGVLLVEDVTASRAAEKQRQHLSNLLVHDLKNPLSAILGNAEFLLEAGPLGGDPTSREALADIREGAKRVERMVLDLLDVAALETGSMSLRLAPVDLRELMEICAKSARSIARKRKLEVLLEIPAEPVIAWVDADVLRRAVDNLAENALRYTPAGGEVRLSVSGGNPISLRVADQGPGIPADLRDRIFERYVSVRMDGERGSNRGLGLTFVQLAAHAHGGRVTVETADGSGSVFRIDLLPLGPSKTS